MTVKLYYMKEGPTICIYINVKCSATIVKNCCMILMLASLIWWKKRSVFDWVCLHLPFHHYIKSSKVNNLQENSNVLSYLCSYHFLRKCFTFAVKFFLIFIPWFLQLMKKTCYFSMCNFDLFAFYSLRSKIQKCQFHIKVDTISFGKPCTLIWQFDFD